MVAARSWPAHEDDADPYFSLSRTNPADWLSLQHAACELGVSVSTLRRRIRKGTLRNRMVPHKGGYAYLVHVPNAMRHGRSAAGPALVGDDRASTEDDRPSVAPRPELRIVPRAGEASANGHGFDEELETLRGQVDRLSEALSRALKLKQRSLPEGMGDPDASPADPYGRYRWLARKRRWWPF